MHLFKFLGIMFILTSHFLRFSHDGTRNCYISVLFVADLEYIKISVINVFYIYTKNIIRNNPIIFMGQKRKLISLFEINNCGLNVNNWEVTKHITVHLERKCEICSHLFWQFQGRTHNRFNIIYVPWNISIVYYIYSNHF